MAQQKPSSRAPVLERGTRILPKDKQFTTPGVFQLDSYEATLTMTTDYLEITTKKTGIIILLQDVKRLYVSPNALGIIHMLPDLTSKVNTTTELRIKDPLLRDEWYNTLSLYCRSAHQSGTSFAPIRENDEVRTFMGGSEYYPVLADALEQAKSEVFIVDWWLSPHVYLKRDPIRNEYRLDNLIKRIADSGVHVYILIYSELPATVELCSAEVIAYMKSLSPNVRAFSTPGLASIYYSHHQKFVVIDRQVAFVGGIDLCYGRYNIPGSHLIDYDKKIFVGQDYYNPSVQSPTVHFKNWDKDVFNRTLHPRMPWQDVHLVVRGEAAKDVAFNFIQRWNCEKKRGNSKQLLIPDFRTSSHPSNWKGDIVLSVQKANKVPVGDTFTQTSDPFCRIKATTKNGKIVVDRRGADSTKTVTNTLDPKWMSLFYFKSEYLDEGPLTISMDIYDYDVGMNDDFLARYEVVIPKNYSEMGKTQTVQLQKKNGNPIKDATLTFSVDWTSPLKNIIEIPNLSPNISVQIVRSASSWSTGGRKENSIQHHYIQLIEEAKHFIYIESQFFISDLGSDSQCKIENKIGSTLLKRIQKAYNEKTPFKVIVVLPLHPEGSPTVSTVQAVMYWQYRTICRDNPNSLVSQLLISCPGIIVENYISFYSLYTHALMPDKVTLVSSQIYVHTKLLIVDDQKMVIGSQNINERSMNGARDSELAAIILNDAQKVPVKYSGTAVDANKIVYDFRIRIMKEHFFTTDESLFADPTGDCYKYWLQTAKSNTQLYKEVFPGMPNDSIVSVAQYCQLLENGANLSKKDLLDQKKGHVIEFPLSFLKTEALRNPIGDDLFI